MLLSYLISFALGYSFIHRVTKGAGHISRLTTCILSVGIGLGISAELTFISFLLANGFNRWVVAGCTISALILLLALNRAQLARLPQTIRAIHWPTLPDGAVSAFFFVISLLTYFIAQKLPDGNWDAWANWNIKTRFLLLGGPAWHDVVQKVHTHTHPDYPLLLPFLNVWSSTFTAGNGSAAALATGVLFTILCGALIYAGLLQHTSRKWAMLGAGLLLTNFYYLFVGTMQYADVFIAY